MTFVLVIHQLIFYQIVELQGIELSLTHVISYPFTFSNLLSLLKLWDLKKQEYTLN